LTNIPIFYETAQVGVITADAGLYAFTYNPEWITRPGAFPISVLASFNSGGMASAQFTPWLTNLLPEGDALAAVGQNLGAATQDVLGILEQIGGDTAGALSIGGPAVRGTPTHRVIPDEANLEKIIEDLPRRPFLAGEDGVSMSLAGAQNKLPVTLVDGKIAIPMNGAPSTHILKPDNSRLEGSVQNEALCMVLAKRIGLNTANVTTGRAGKRTYLLVERYDRRADASVPARLHQEDFCQALGKPPAAKYQHNQVGIRGPSLRDMFEVVRQYMPATDLLALLDAVILNVLMTNVDSHAKNYSIMLSGNGVRLAPLYDLMAGDAWPDITLNMAQDIGGQRRGAHVQAKNWRRFAEECQFNPAQVLRRVQSVSKRVAGALDVAAEEVRGMPAGDHFMLDLFVEKVKARVKAVNINLTENTTAE